MKLITIGIVVLISSLVHGMEGKEKSFIFPERKALWKRVLEVTEAERNWPRELHEALATGQISCHQGSVVRTEDVLSLRPPEDLLFFGQGNTIALIYADPLNENHSVFGPFNTLIGELQNLLLQTQETSAKLIKKAITYYQSFRDRLITGDKKAKDALLEPKVTLIGENGKFYHLSQEIARSLVSKDKYGFTAKTNATGMHAVKAKGDVHFKFFAEETLDSATPGHEFMAYAFAKVLTEDPLLTPSVLLKLERVSFLLRPSDTGWQNQIQLKHYTYFVQASKTVGTKDLSKYLEISSSLRVRPSNLNWHMLFTLLLCPGDGKADNYSVEEEPDGTHQIIGIDNDKFWYSPLYKGGERVYPGVNSIFYAWSEIQDSPFTTDVREAVFKISATSLVLKWFSLLEQQNQVYQNLCQRNLLTETELHFLNLPLTLVSGTLQTLHSKWEVIQKLLKDHPQMVLEAFTKYFYPDLSTYYQEIRMKYNDPLASMWVIYKGRNASGVDQSVKAVLNRSVTYLSSRVPVFDQSLEAAFEEELSKDQFSPKTLWHQLIKIDNSSKLWQYLHQKDPEGINRLDDMGLSPLDHAIEHFVNTGKGLSFQRLITLGANVYNISLLKMHRVLKASQNPEVLKGFRTLKRLNGGKGEWKITLEEIFPPYKGKGRSILGSSVGQRSFLPEIQVQLKDNARMPFGRRKVVRVDHNGQSAYVKFYPELPGLEEAVGILSREILGWGAPYGDLFRLDTGEPVWISQGIEGDTLQEALSKDPTLVNLLDEESLSDMILMAMLINPEDGKSDNYILEPLPGNPQKYRLVGIDNEQAFVSAFVQDMPERTAITKKLVPIAQVKTILYCFDQMTDPIHPQTRERFLSLNPASILKSWLEKLHRRNENYRQVLYSDFNEVIELFTKHKCFMGVPFQKGAVAHLYTKLCRLQDWLTGNPKMTHLELLRKLEPRLANRYSQAFILPKTSKPFSIVERFDRIDGGVYRKIQTSYATVTPSGTILESQNIPFKQTTLQSIRSHEDLGPTQALEELKSITRQQRKEVKAFQDIPLDIQLERVLSEYDFSLHPMTQQRNLLRQLQGRQLSYLTLKKCSALSDTIFKSTIKLEHLITLDLSNSPEIIGDIIQSLAERAINLEQLSLAEAPKLRYVAKDTVFSYERVIFPSLLYLNLQNCSALEVIFINAPRLKKIWSTEYRRGKQLVIQDAPLESLSLYDIIRSFNDTAKISFTRGDWQSPPGFFRLIKRIGRENSQLFLRAFWGDPSLISLDLSLSQIGDEEAKMLDQLIFLKTLNLRNNKIGDDGVEALTQLTSLESLNLSENRVGGKGAKALVKFASLTELYLSGNKIRDEGATALAQLTSLTKLILLDNEIREEGAKALTQLMSLKVLNLSSNQIRDEGAKALAQLTLLNSLELNSSEISDEGVKVLAAQLTLLDSLGLNFNQINNGGVEALARLTALKFLYLSGNNIRDEGAKALAQLTLHTLYLSWNKVGDKGAEFLAQNTTFTKLEVFSNQIEVEGKEALKNSPNTNLRNLIF